MLDVDLVYWGFGLYGFAGNSLIAELMRVAELHFLKSV